MKINPFQMFFAEPDDSGGSALDLMGSIDNESPSEVEVQNEPEPEKPASSLVDAQELANRFGSVIGEQMRGFAPKPEEPKPLTPEEARKLLKIWEPDDDFIAKFGNLETQKEAFIRLRDGMTTQNVTIMQSFMQELEKRMEERYAPALSFMQAQEQEKLAKGFQSSFPELANPQLQPLVSAVALDLKSKGQKFKDATSMFKAIAAGVEATIKVHNPEFKLTGAASAAPKPKPSSAIPVVSGGSGGGGGGTSSTSGSKSVALGVLGKVKG